MSKSKTPTQAPTLDTTGFSAEDLVKALVQAISLTRPVEKKNAANRKPGSPWDSKDGKPKLKLKRKMYQHSIMIDPDVTSNEDIALLNKLKVGRFLDGWVRVYRRKDNGIDIDYPVKTASQRMKLGVRSFGELLQKCIDEAANPVKLDAYQDEDDN